MNDDLTLTPPAGGEEYFGRGAWAKLVRFAELLESEGQLRGLVGPREMDKLWDRHILNSTAISPYISKGAHLADVGSGAGFPGLVIAIVRPDLTIDLIEAMERRTDWLDYCVSELKLPNVTVIRARAEDVNIQADYVTARAVAALKKLIPWTLPLVKPGGSLVALKGARAEKEIDDAVKHLEQFDVEWADVYDVDVWGAEEGTRVVELKKLS